MNEDSFARQQDLVPRGRISATLCTVIGIGAVGRNVALQLAAIGAPRLQLIDFDAVEDTNVTTQGYLADDVGRPKVEAVAEALLKLRPTIQVTCTRDRYRAKYLTGDAVFCCVDSIETRGIIWRAASRRHGLWVDGRMLGEVVRILAADNQERRNYYGDTLFDRAQAQRGRCTAQSTIYAASTTASVMVHQFTRWLRDIPVDRDTLGNLLAGEWDVTH